MTIDKSRRRTDPESRALTLHDQSRRPLKCKNICSFFDRRKSNRGSRGLATCTQFSWKIIRELRELKIRNRTPCSSRPKAATSARRCITDKGRSLGWNRAHPFSIPKVAPIDNVARHRNWIHRKFQRADLAIAQQFFKWPCVENTWLANAFLALENLCVHGVNCTQNSVRVREIWRNNKLL